MSEIRRHIDERHYLPDHFQPATCEPCRHLWHSLRSARRIAYARRRLSFGCTRHGP